MFVPKFVTNGGHLDNICRLTLFPGQITRDFFLGLTMTHQSS